MMGTEQPVQATNSVASSDLLGSLLGNLTGTPQQSQSPDSGDVVGLLLSGLMSGASTSQLQTQSGSNDLLGSLLSSLGGSSTDETQPQSGSEDMIGSLLGSLTGNQQSNTDGRDMTDLLSARLAYYAAKQQGGYTTETSMQTLNSASPLGQWEDRNNPVPLVINAILSRLGKKK